MSENDLIRRKDALRAVMHTTGEAYELIYQVPAAPTITAADLENLANAVWSEYHSSLEEKWTFRKEHVLNAMIADLTQRVKKGPAHD